MAIQWAPILKAVFVEAIPALVDLIKSAIEAGEDQAAELRGKPITISVAFGGGEGEAVVYQRTIEAKLPDDFDLGDDPTLDPAPPADPE